MILPVQSTVNGTIAIKFERVFLFVFYCQSNNLSAFKFLYIHLISSSNYRCQHCLKRFSIFLEELCLHILFYQEYFSLRAVLTSLVGEKKSPQCWIQKYSHGEIWFQYDKSPNVYLHVNFHFIHTNFIMFCEAKYWETPQSRHNVRNTFALKLQMFDFFFLNPVLMNHVFYKQALLKAGFIIGRVQC